MKTKVTLAEMIAACGFDRINDHITETNFPVKPELFTVDGLQVIHNGQTMTTENILADFDKRGLKAGTIEQLLAYAEKNPEEQMRYPIIALGSWVDPVGYRGFPCLSEYEGKRVLFLYGDTPGHPSHESNRFLVSNK